MTKTPHKHAALIKAWADGATIEILIGSRWRLKTSPHWDADYEYRIKPEPKPDVIKYVVAYHDQHGSIISNLSSHQYKQDNVKFTFDGETNKLKSVEIIK